jgi:cysteine desulfurase
VTSAPIYLDNNSTTPIDPRVIETMCRAWREFGANPASQHSLGRKARKTLEESREGILELLGAKTSGMNADQLIFTSGGTEANNLAIFGMAGSPGERVVISAIEHPSIARAADELRRRGWKVEALTDVFTHGVVCVPSLFDESGMPPRLVSLMLANNETGAEQPIKPVAERYCNRGTKTHTDAVQAVGKIGVNFRDLGVDAMTVSPHKFHGPLGIGALLLRHGVALQPQLFGGFQQGGLRPGTENVALAAGFQSALQLAVQELGERAARMRTIRDELERTIIAELDGVVIIGEDEYRLPNTSCVSFPGLDRQALVMALDLAGVACSTGSACASGSSEPSPTLVAMGLPKAVIDGAIRLSVGAFTTADEVAEAASRIIKTVKHLRTTK